MQCSNKIRFSQPESGTNYPTQLYLLLSTLIAEMSSLSSSFQSFAVYNQRKDSVIHLYLENFLRLNFIYLGTEYQCFHIFCAFRRADPKSSINWLVHRSPHSVDKRSRDQKIGSGEGSKMRNFIVCNVHLT